MSKTRASIRSSGRALAMVMTASLVVAALTVTVAPAATPTFTAVGSARQVYVTGLAPSTQMALVNSAGTVVKTQKASSLGGLLFRDVPPATGYRVRRVSDGVQSGKITVHSESAAQWNPGIYDQTIPSNGYTYLTTRDGTKLAVNVHPPTSPAGEPGLPPGIPIPNGPAFAPPYPTLIEYSGYGYANPAGPTSGIAVLANLMGFAVVDVNMRGTGCSGGAFDFFEPLQSLDGYDVIETIARQPWVRDHKVGMMGISYGGISQLFTAQLQPPHLEAISPLSVLDATATTLYPGGILNNGFAVAWAKERQHEALPAGPNSGQPWAYKRIQSGDTTCAANQVLHGEAADLNAKIAANSHYDAAVADPLDPVTFVHKIKVPTFMACQWEDEQTGGHCAELVRKFTGTTQKWFTFTNGAHIDSLDPDTYNRWYDFLQLFVAHQAPIQNAAITRGRAGHLPDGDGPPADRRGHPAGRPHPVDPDVRPGPRRVQRAAAGAGAVRQRRGQGAPRGREPRRPLRRVRPGLLVAPRRRHHGAHVVLRVGRRAYRHVADERGVNAFNADAHALPRTDFGANTGTGGLWGNASQWQWNWQQNPSGTAVSYVSAPLTAEHHGRRERRGLALGAIVDPRRRPAGHDQRGASGRERDVRAERLDPRERAQALDELEQHVQAAEHGARADPHLHRGRRVAHAGRTVRQGRRPALLPGPRVPRRVAHPRDDRRAERHAADLGLRRDGAERGHVDRVFQRHAVEPRPPGRSRRECADAAAAVSEPAQRAVPAVPSDREHHGRSLRFT